MKPTSAPLRLMLLLLPLHLGCCCCLIHVDAEQHPTPTRNGGNQDQSYQDPAKPTTITTTGAQTNARPPDLLNILLWPVRAVINGAGRLLIGRRRNRSSDEAAGAADGADSSIELGSFKMFMSRYNKSYSAEEIPRRMELFFRRRSLIENSIASYRQGRTMFFLAENEFIDWDEQELKRLTGVTLPSDFSEEAATSTTTVASRQSSFVRRPQFGAIEEEPNRVSNANNNNNNDNNTNISMALIAAQATAAAPAGSADWRRTGCVSEPIYQGECGSAGYAIATMGVVESMMCLNKNRLVNLSAQQIVDCAAAGRWSNSGAYGCSTGGGWPGEVLRYMSDVKLVAHEACYPYESGQRGACRLESAIRRSTGGGCIEPSGLPNVRHSVLRDERAILEHVATSGPLVGLLEATESLFFYGGGVFDDPQCTGSLAAAASSQAVVIVGFGQVNGVDYWTIRNSWGPWWGRGGYLYLRRGVSACSIGRLAWAVVVDD